MTRAMYTARCHLGCCTGLPATPAGCTPWLCGQTTPVQPGVYKRLYRPDARQGAKKPLFCYFDDHWFGGFFSVAGAVAWPHQAFQQALPWCGLITPPPCGYGAAATPRPTTIAGVEPC